MTLMAAPANKRLFLVDGMSQIYRAYYAIRGLATSTGIPTNAIYGFTMMLRKLISAEKPDYLGVVFDTPEPTFRHESYQQYKATRTKMPDDLTVQMSYIERVCQALRVPVTRFPGYEADDIIGTFARQAEAAGGLDVFIVTNDKDLCQLVTERVKVLKSDRDGNTVLMDAKSVEEKLGVRPDQIPDLLGLMGDTIDNIPGAPGVGEKGAKQIIQQYGSIANALAHASEILRKPYRESLTNNADQIRQSRELAEIKCDVPVSLDLDALVYEQPNRQAAYVLFSELEFSQLTREFADAAEAAGVQAAAHTHTLARRNYWRVTTRKELERLIASCYNAERVALAPAEREGSLYGLAISPEHAAAAIVDFDKFETDSDPLAILKEVLENGLVHKCVHDWKGLLTSLERYQCQRERQASSATGDGCVFDFKPAVRINGVGDDTMLAAYLLDPNRTSYRLPEIAREALGIDMASEVDGFDIDDSRALQSADLIRELVPV